MSKFFILAILFVSTMCVCARAQENPSTQETLTLNQAVAEAKYNSRLIKISQQSIVSANDQILATRTQRLPHFNVQMTAGSLLTPVGIAFNKGVFGNINNTPNPPDNVVVTTSPKFSGFGIVEAYQPLSQLYNIHLKPPGIGSRQTPGRRTDPPTTAAGGQLRQRYLLFPFVRSAPKAARVRDDWGQDGFEVTLKVDSDRANLAGVTNQDVAQPSGTAMSGASVSTLRRGDEQVPVVSRLRMEERASLSDIQNLYVYSSESNNKVPLLSISTISNILETLRIRRLEHFRAISEQSFTVPGALASEVFSSIAPKLNELRKTLPPGYSVLVSGEQAKQEQGFRNLTIVMAISIALIFIALAIQFRHAIKPVLVLAAAPYGVVGAPIALYVMGAPFGFMAFLGIASLIGVIVSHVIVLFDFIEEMHEKGEPIEQAFLDAGIVRLRPVLITVGATVLALFPLAVHGGPLWQPLCYAQIGGLGIATFITLLLVPVLYSIFVFDLKLVKWAGAMESANSAPVETSASKGELP